jgi:gliding-associated putative ABC transporter substrate-binding component GldG
MGTFFQSRKGKDLLFYGIAVVVLVLVNIVNTGFFIRIDLTEEQKYSLRPATRALLNNADDVITVEVFLEGDMPAGFKRFQRAIRESLQEFQIYAGENLQFFFTNPSEGLTGEALSNAYLNLAKKGLTPTNLTIAEGDQRIDKVIFPGALVSYKGQEKAVLLLKGNFSAPPELRINQSIEGIEYELSNAIKKLSNPAKKRIAITAGNGEPSDLALSDAARVLAEYYQIERVRLPEKLHLKEYDLVIVANPDSTFSEADKFKLDQYVVKGGRVLLLADIVEANIDSIGEAGTYALAKNLGLDDWLFSMGVRLNPDLIQDLYCSPIPLFVGYEGEKPITKLMPWKYYPLINQFGEHPISRNLDALYSRFVGSLDTVKSEGIAKTPLLFTSPRSRVLPAPVRLNFAEVKVNLEPKVFNKGPLPIAYLLEGRFKSCFDGRVKPEAIEKLEYRLQTEQPGKVIVVSDGDLLLNEVNAQGQARPLGYDRFTRMQFANKEFLLNAVDYLLDDSGVIVSRSKQVTFRPLDKDKVTAHGWWLQLINVGLPILVVVAFGLGYRQHMKRTYANFD